MVSVPVLVMAEEICQIQSPLPMLYGSTPPTSSPGAARSCRASSFSITARREDEDGADADDIARIGVAPVEPNLCWRSVPGVNVSAIIQSAAARASLIL